MTIVGLSTLYIILREEPFEHVVRDVEYEREEDERPDVWEIVDDAQHPLTHDNLRLVQGLYSQGYSFTIHSPYSGLNIADLDESRRRESLARLKKSIESAARIEAKALVLHPGMKARDQTISQRLNDESIITLYDYAESFGIVLALENMNPNTQYFMIEPSEFEEFFERNSIRLRMTFDLGHAHIGSLEKDFVSRLSDKFMIIHAHDNNGAKDEHLGIGDGSIDWESITTQLNEMDFRGMYIVESFEKPYESVARLRGMLGPV
ncbi:MAG: sugar phosphate isomerase/epimerase family protein [Nitrososphaerales archaeon]